MNQILNKELKQVEENKKRFENTTNTQDEENLQRILHLLTGDHKKPEGHVGKLKQEIEDAENQLRKKTQIYVKLINK